ncbi:MAG TPA: hypothetical protein VGK20_04665 [Candidatus Binatia bacterium]|jgi:hypothetical protein
MAGEQATGGSASLGIGRADIRPSNVRALAGLSAAIVLRLLREGLVIRALAWPGVLTAFSMFASAALTIAWRNNPVIYVDDSALVAPLAAEHFEVRVAPDAAATLKDGRAERAVWREGDRLVLGATWGGLLTYKAESVLRDYVGERWRLQLPPPVKRSRDSVELRPFTGLLAGIVGLLFTLYGVVIGAGSLYRDRSSGVLESDLALAIPRWIHGAARLVALAVVLGPALVVSLFVVDALMPIHSVQTWIFVGFMAALFGGALGVVLLARAGSQKGFSAPLSQALSTSMGLITLGYVQPGFGHYLPLVSLGSAFAGTPPSWAVVPVTLAVAALVSADFHRRECV